jgi:formylglycine-generating enzyme required for sulfatase activity
LTLAVTEFLAAYADDPDPGVHGAVAWFLRAAGREEIAPRLAELDQRFATGEREGQRLWYVNRRLQTFTVLPGPHELMMGTPVAEPACPGEPPNGLESHGEPCHLRRIPRSFAIGVKPVTVAEVIRCFGQDFVVDTRYTPTEDCPALAVTWFQAAEYCNWLSDQEGIPEEQWCYQPNADSQFAPGMCLTSDCLARTGYRLPTEAEWEFACRAGTVTSRYYGWGEDLLGKYAWYLGNASNQARPVGRLKPNAFGLFDMLGNVWEWCHNRWEAYPEGPADDTHEEETVGIDARILRGGSFFLAYQDVRSDHRLGHNPTDGRTSFGFRVARTVP